MATIMWDKEVADAYHVVCAALFEPDVGSGDPAFVPDDGGFGVHTFRLVNAAGATCLVKFHWKPGTGDGDSRFRCPRAVSVVEAGLDR